MKKIILFIIIYIIICFAIPILFTKRYSVEGIVTKTEENKKQRQEQGQEQGAFNYKQYNSIKYYMEKQVK